MNYAYDLPLMGRLRSQRSNNFNFQGSEADGGLFREYNINAELNPMKESNQFTKTRMIESSQFRVSDFEK